MELQTLRCSLAAWVLIWATLACRFTNAHDEWESLEYFSKKQFNASDLAEAANHFIEMGETQALKKMEEVSITRQTKGPGDPTSLRMIFLMRVIFQPQKQAIRRPLIGAFFIPIDGNDQANWPHFPLVKSGDSYFLLTNSMGGTGIPESTTKYLQHCMEHGTFRKEKISVPNRKQAESDLDKLWLSKRWQSIDWKVPNPQAAEQHYRKFIQKQAETIEDKATSAPMDTKNGKN